MEKDQARKKLYELLGDLPARDRPIAARCVTQERRGYVLEKLLLDLNGIEPVPAYFVYPEGARHVPTVLYNHAHGGDYELGKEELLCGRGALQSPPYAEALTAQGYAALCIDTWAFGERRGRTESAIFKQMLWNGQVMWGMMVYDSLRAIDYLATREEVVDMSRLGTLGISMGSTMAWWTAALDPRIKVCIDICCLTDYQVLIEAQGLDGHGIYYYVPKLLKHFTTAEINALIAPRPHLSLAGIYDGLTPPAGLDRIDRALQAVYEREGASDAWRLARYAIGHFETAAMRAEIMAFLDAWI